jgi:endoglucanase
VISGAFRAARFAAILATVSLMGVPTSSGLAEGNNFQRPPMRLSVQNADWNAYKDAFVTSDGRIVDTANGNITHSEGQGYGMLLAVAADDPATFELIWSFTRTEMLIRDDGLVAWKWDPAASPHIADVNNATDGDLLIAYALNIAGERWRKPEYREAAKALSRVIVDDMLVPMNGETYILPGAEGFQDEADPERLIVNPSYWVFPALRNLQRLGGAETLDKTLTTGLNLLQDAQFSARKLPSDWVEIASESVAPAPDLEEVFSYNSIRIPLYLLLAGIERSDLLQPYFDDWVERGNGSLMTVDVSDGTTISTLSDPGYRMLAALVSCAVAGKSIPDDLRSFSPTEYYPSTLHLLGLSVARGRYPEC